MKAGNQLAGVLAVVLVMVGGRAEGQTTFTWANSASGSSGNWTTPASWDVGVSYPGAVAGNTATMPAAASGFYTNILNTVIPNGVILNLANGGVLRIDNGGTVTNTASAIVNWWNGTTGKIYLNEGGKLTSPNAVTIGYKTTGINATVSVADGTGGRWDILGSYLRIGEQNSSNSLTIENGAELYVPRISVGYPSNLSGGKTADYNNFNVGGPGAASYVSVAGEVYVGDGGGNTVSSSYNKMTVTNATVAVAGDLRIGIPSPSHKPTPANYNQLTVLGGGTVTVTGDILIGLSGHTGNSLAITNGTVSASSLTLSGTDSSVTVADGGTLTLSGTASVNGTSIFGGAGTVSGDVVVAAGASLAPGAPLGTLNIQSNLNISSMAGGTGKLIYEMDTPAASGKIVLPSGLLTIGTGLLGLGDFELSNAGGLDQGTYTLIETSQPISGTLTAGETNGILDYMLIELRISADGTDLELVASRLNGDATAPTLVSIANDQDDGPVTSHRWVTYTVTFDEDMIAETVDAADFDNAGTASIDVGTITRISPRVFTVQIMPTSGGTLQLRLPTTATIRDLAGNYLAVDPPLDDGVSITVNFDNTPPTLAASDIVDHPGSGSVEVGTSYLYTLTFDEDIETGSVNATDFDNAGTAAITIGLILKTAPGVFVVEVTPTTTGTVQLRLPASATIQDLAGNALTALPVLDDTTLTVTAATGAIVPVANYDFSIDTGSWDADPDVTASLFAASATGFDASGRNGSALHFFTRNAPTVFDSDSGYVGFTVTAHDLFELDLRELTFNYGVQNAGEAYTQALSVRTSADGFAVDLPGSYSANPAASQGNTATTPQSARFVLSGAAFQDRETLELRIYMVNSTSTNSNISLIDNILLTGKVSAMPTESDPPVLVDIVDDKSGASVEANSRVVYTVSFNRDIDAATVDAADFANAGTSVISIGAITEISRGVFTVEVIPQTAGGTLQLQIPTTATIADMFGNLLDSDPALVDDVILDVTADVTAPTLTGSDIVDDRDGGPILPGTLITYTITFSEDIDAGSVAANDFDNAGSSTITIGAITEIAPGRFTVAVTPDTIGTLQLRLPSGAFILDAAGIALAGLPVLDDTIIAVENLAPVINVALNQIGYQKDAPKRFTAIDALNGTPFTITAVSDPGTVLYSGTITNKLGDFSAFQPDDPGSYVVNTHPNSGAPGISYPFLVQADLLEQKLVIPAIQFMVDARSGVGTHNSAGGGTAWRDGTYYSFEVPSLIYLYLNVRDIAQVITNEIDHAADMAKVMDPGFSLVSQIEDAGFLEDLRAYYDAYDPPLPGCPDVIKMVHFGLGITMQRPESKDWSDARQSQLHSQKREWFAWFLYAWPELSAYLPESFYIACRDFTFANWSLSAGLDTPTIGDDNPSPLEIDPLWHPSTYNTFASHPFKGRNVPGHSIQPNLLLWQVALREGREDAAIYLEAAQTQTQWVIDNLDWNDPPQTKGHRMAEHKLMQGLVHFLRKHPDEAPAGLATKIEQWADVIISRSHNFWDFRRYELTDTDGDGVVDWTLPKRASNWNEPGNLAGFPVCALSAAWTLDHAPAKQQRLRELAQAAIDCLFGRNPLNTGSASRPHLGFPDQETSWTPVYEGGIGQLALCRGALASGPGSEHFPNNPGAAKRWNEGWVNFNAALNVGLAYMLADRQADPDPLPVGTFSTPAAVILNKTTLSVSEEGATSEAYTIRLHTEPTDDVTVTLGVSESGQVTLSADELVFTPENWATPQLITVTAIDDDDLEVSPHTVTISHTATSPDGEYDNIDIADVIVSIVDNDTPGITVIPTALSISEEGPTFEAYAIVLNTEPSSSVTVTPAVVSGQVTLSTSELVFATNNWSTAQPITVTAIDDAIVEASPHTVTILHTAASPDAGYHEIEVADVTVSITDNDTAGITLNKTTLDISEEGPASGTYTLVLDTEPTHSVTVTPAVVSGQVTLSASELVFATNNWSIAQPVTVTAIDDDAPEANPHTVSISHSATSPDANYNGGNIAIASVTVNITDNDAYTGQGGLLAHWTFDNDLTNEVTGTYNAQNDGVVHDTTTYKVGGGAARFTANKDLHGFGTISFAGTDPWTVSFWYQDTNTITYIPGIIGDGSNTDYNMIRLGDDNANRSIGFFPTTGVGEYTPFASGSGTVILNTWYHLTMVADGEGKLTLYRSGLNPETKTGRTTSWIINNIGDAYSNSDRNFYGLLDDVAVWGVALTAGEALGLQNFVLGGFDYNASDLNGLYVWARDPARTHGNSYKLGTETWFYVNGVDHAGRSDGDLWESGGEQFFLHDQANDAVLTTKPSGRGTLLILM